MTFDDLVTGDSVFLDANTLVYHFTPHPQLGRACSRLVQRIQNQDLLGFTSTHLVTELAHRLMTFEAGALAGWSPGKVTRRLRQQPTTICNLSRFRVAVESLFNSRIQVLTIPGPLVLTATILSQQIGLLSNDALIVVIMQANGLSKLASHDNDFDRIAGITRYGPQ
jgi:predicted nucleic acid-binding protein